MVCLPGGLCRLDSHLDVVGVERVLRKQLLGLGHRLSAMTFLHKPHYLHLGHLVAELRAKASLAVPAEVSYLRGTKQPARLEDVWSRRDGLHQHVDRELVAPGLKGLTTPVCKILRLLCEVNRHYETSSLVSPGLSKTPPAL